MSTRPAGQVPLRIAANLQPSRLAKRVVLVCTGMCILKMLGERVWSVSTVKAMSSLLVGMTERKYVQVAQVGAH